MHLGFETKVLLIRFEMQMKIKYLLLTLFLLNSLQTICNESLKGGLYFQSFEVDKDKRTCLNLTPDRALNLGNGFTMEFDLNLRREVQNFGYIFRLICNDTLNIDLLSDITSNETNYSLITGRQTLIKYQNSEINFVPETWIKVRLRCDPVKNEIDLSLNGVKKTVQCVLDKPKQLRAYFGGNAHDVFSTTDIAPMTVRDIRISDLTSHPVRYWKLGSHAHHVVYDECEHARAVMTNPQWVIDSHAKWNKQISLILPGVHYYITFDPVNDRIFVVKDKIIFIYHAKNRTTDTVEVRRGTPFNTESNNQLEYNPNKDELISYHFESNHLATFNFSTLEWNNEDNTVIIPRYGHHSNFYMADDNLLLTFGGYGYHRYNSILHKYNSVTDVWENYDMSASIAPRYLGGMGYLGENKILCFGGFGNETGRQEEFPKNYYDLYSIDIDQITAQKIWELPNPKEHFTNSNSLIIDKNNRKFYDLAYPNKRYASVIKLHEYNLDKPEYRVVGDSIPYFFNDVGSYCNLFQSSDSAELYAITSSVRNDVTEINIYSIAFPTLSLEEIIQQPPSRVNVRGWIWLAIPIGLMVVFITFRRKRCKRMDTDDFEDKQITDGEEKPIVYNHLFAEKKHSFIHLLGNFQIVNGNGHDITKNLTPTTTQLFLLLLMSTAKNGKGIASKELRNILWFDKDDNSARNNRNVYIAKLRSILKDFAEVRVVNHENYFSIQFEKTVFCDYERVLILMKTLKTSNQFNKKILDELVDIALKGTLVPHFQQLEWIEPYLSDYTAQLIECLMKYSKHEEVKTDLLLLLKIADTILLHDNIDEEAIRLKCYALFRSGRKNLALQTFNKFTADYEKLLATNHHLVFEELVKPV